MNQLRIQLHQLEEEHQLVLGEKDAVNAENLKFRATVAELEAELSGMTAQMIREQKVLSSYRP